MSVERILRGVSATLTQQVTVNEVGTDPAPDEATVTVTRADGTVLAADLAAVNDTAGRFSVTLTPAQTALLDTLTLTWTFTYQGFVQTLPSTAEIAGGYLFSLPELRQFEPLQDTAKYPTAKLAQARTTAETIIEDACGVAFVPRYWHGRVSDLASNPVAEVRRIRSAIRYDGVTLTVDELNRLLYNVDSLYRYGWRQRGSWTVGIEHGLDSPPMDVARATLLLTRQILVSNQNAGTGTLDERATSVTYADAGLSYQLTTPGMRGATTSLPDVNEVVERYKRIAIA